jgi:hypothetical protein
MERSMQFSQIGKLKKIAQLIVRHPVDYTINVEKEKGKLRSALYHLLQKYFLYIASFPNYITSKKSDTPHTNNIGRNLFQRNWLHPTLSQN